jgi:hypothetical protein
MCSAEEEKRYIGELKQFQKEEMGYQWIQGTRPQTLAYGLTERQRRRAGKRDLAR